PARPVAPAAGRPDRLYGARAAQNARRIISARVFPLADGRTTRRHGPPAPDARPAHGDPARDVGAAPRPGARPGALPTADRAGPAARRFRRRFLPDRQARSP